MSIALFFDDHGYVAALRRPGGRTETIITCDHTHLLQTVPSDRGAVWVNPISVRLRSHEDDVPQPYRVKVGLSDACCAIIQRGADGIPRDISPATPHGLRATVNPALRDSCSE